MTAMTCCEASSTWSRTSSAGSPLTSRQPRSMRSVSSSTERSRGVPRPVGAVVAAPRSSRAPAPAASPVVGQGPLGVTSFLRRRLIGLLSQSASSVGVGCDGVERTRRSSRGRPRRGRSRAARRPRRSAPASTRCDDQLGDPVAPPQHDRLVRVEVDQGHLDLAAVAGVHGAGGVDDRQPGTGWPAPSGGGPARRTPRAARSPAPVGTRARSPGARRTSTVVVRSAPASPRWAYDGSGTSGSRRRTGSSTFGAVRRSAGRRHGSHPRPVPRGDRLRPMEQAYVERLSVPLRWWALAVMFWATLLLAFLIAMPPLAAIGRRRRADGAERLLLRRLGPRRGQPRRRGLPRRSGLHPGRPARRAPSRWTRRTPDGWPGSTPTPGPTCCCAPTSGGRSGCGSSTRRPDAVLGGRDASPGRPGRLPQRRGLSRQRFAQAVAGAGSGDGRSGRLDVSSRRPRAIAADLLTDQPSGD